MSALHAIQPPDFCEEPDIADPDDTRATVEPNRAPREQRICGRWYDGTGRFYSDDD